MKDVLESLLARRDLSIDQAESLVRQLALAETPPGVVGAVLAALRAKGETADEVAGFARGMRSMATRPAFADGASDDPNSAPMIDIVGTGGDNTGSFNISTGAALLTAAAANGKLRVVKHGNRAVSGRCGAADVLEALGLPMPLDEERAAACLHDTGFTFLFAPHYHLALRAIGAVRRELGVRTIFNILGPLTNPANPPFAVLGAYSLAVAKLMADAVSKMDIRRVFVIHGADGWDEPTPMGPFTLFDVRPGSVVESRRDPADAGLARCDAGALLGGDARHNAAELRRVFAGERSGHRDALVLGAGLALDVAGLCASLRDGCEQAAAAIDDGRASGLLDKLLIAAQTGEKSGVSRA